jgi:uncharacterized protein
MSTVILLHAWYDTPLDHWYPWLKTKLEKKGYTVLIPVLPTMASSSPDPEPMIHTVVPLLALDGSTSLIGHSLGSILALHIAEKHKLQKLILTAAWDFDDLTPEHAPFWKTKTDHQAIIRNVSSITCIGSSNDPYISHYQQEGMAKRLDAKFIEIPGGRHLTKEDGFTTLPDLGMCFGTTL